MNILDAFLLGLVQGLAEFLPISSSGHLVIAGNFLGVVSTNIFFEVFLHLATLFSIFVYFRKDIFSLKISELKLIIIASIPAAFVGILFRSQLELLFDSVVIVSLLLMMTGVINLITDKKLNDNANLNSSELSEKKIISTKEAFIIGIFQAVAILPGISRSGSTLAGGVLQNIDREKAFKFSFLIVIPAILGASLIQILELANSNAFNMDFGALVVGGLTAFISGLISLKSFEFVIIKTRLRVFGFYCIFVGMMSLIFNYLG